MTQADLTSYEKGDLYDTVTVPKMQSGRKLGINLTLLTHVTLTLYHQPKKQTMAFTQFSAIIL